MQFTTGRGELQIGIDWPHSQENHMVMGGVLIGDRMIAFSWAISAIG